MFVKRSKSSNPLCKMLRIVAGHLGSQSMCVGMLGIYTHLLSGSWAVQCELFP